MLNKAALRQFGRRSASDLLFGDFRTPNILLANCDVVIGEGDFTDD